MQICFVASNYPTETRQVHVFLDNVVQNLVDRGVECNVIAPQSTVSWVRRPDQRRDFVSQRKTKAGNSYMVYSPLFTVFPSKKLGGIYFSDFSKRSYFKALHRTYRKYDLKADLVYSHFIQAGIPAVMLAQELGIPSFIANGEADTIREVSNISPALVKRTLEQVTGIISVSTKNKDEIATLSGGDTAIMDKTVIIPNAVNVERFHKMDRAECRKELGMPQDAFIVAFTGSFIERKGVMKVSRAIDAIDGAHGVFIGVGEQMPNCRNILHCGRVQNEVLGKYLNAADVFALPTLAEGCSNAVVEAVACGLPVVSSDRAFNWDVLDDSCAILIDPENEKELQQAIRKLKDDEELRMRLANGSLERAKMLSLDVRVDRILDFIMKQRKQ